MAPAGAVYDEYLETNMRAITEGLLQALLVKKPAHGNTHPNTEVEVFCIEWLTNWNKERDQEEQVVSRLTAEKELLLHKRNELSELLSNKENSFAAELQAWRANLQEGGSSSSAVRTSSKRQGSKGSFASQGSEDAEAKEQEKIQRMKSKDRRAGVSAEAISEERRREWKKPFHEKTEEDREFLKTDIDRSEKLQVLFGHLSKENLYDVIGAMFPKEVNSGENIITQGEEGDNFYIVKEGSFDVFVRRNDVEATKVLQYGPGDMFGELALMYNATRAATVTATSDSKLWALDRDSFQMMLTTAENTQRKLYEGFLDSVEIFQDLTRYEIAQLSDMLQSDAFDDGEAIITQGEEGRYFYIIEEGEAKAYIGGDKGEIEVKHYKQPGEYFGEIALLTAATRKATVRGAGRGCSVLSVSKEDFISVLGPIKDILQKNIDKYPQYEEFIRDEEERLNAERVEQEKINQIQTADRRAGVSAPVVSEDRMKDWTKPFFEKLQEVRERIKDMIAKSDKLQVLFGHLADESVLSVIDAMKPQTVDAGTNLITQGEEGDNFYIVDEGQFDVFVQRGDAPPGKVLEYGSGDMFGELALMYNAPRAATVKALSSAKVWALDRESFQLMLTTAENVRKSQYEDFLSKIEMFQVLTKYELSQLSDMLESEPFDGGEDIISQGDEGRYFYLIEEGEAKAYIDGENGEIEVKHYKEPGEFFGEVALLTNSARKATVRAVGSRGCAVLSVSREDFDRVLGPIKDILQANVDKYPAYADMLARAGVQ
mmetsp:Transcript_5339/g.9536  ORF Transcript_5339/g.9536 Transcript_5339/m.9536 type:complete len:770 (+) Transcript_5339:30-2339(+)